MNNTISVITVAKDSEKTIKDTSLSIKRQTYGNIEHVLIDAQSSDDTVKLAKENSIKRLVVVSEPDKGIYDAMNKGITVSKGGIIGFLNSDDMYMDGDVLKLVARAFESPHVDIVFGNLVYVKKNRVDQIVRFWDSSSFNSKSLKYGLMPPHPTLFVRRSIIEEIGGFRTDLKMANDYEFCLRLFLKREATFIHIPEVLVKMRLGGESNRSFWNIIYQNWCIYKALRSNDLSLNFGFIFIKPLNKIGQFFSRKTL